MPYGAQEAAIYETVYDRPITRDYEADAQLVRRLVTEYGRSDNRHLLDVACGPGRHLELLMQDFSSVEGVDLSGDLLAIAKRRLPEVRFYQADMVSFSTGKHYGAITCLFSAIGYTRTPKRLRRAIVTMARHLSPGGTLIVEPWLHPGACKTGRGTIFVEQPGFVIARVTNTLVRNRVSICTQHSFVDRQGSVTHFVEVHELGLFTVRQYMNAFCAAGLEVWHDPVGFMGRGLFVGRKSA